MATIGDRVKRARTRKGWTQLQLAEATGLHRVAIGNIEAGIRGVRPRPATIDALAQVLGVRVEWLMIGERPMLRQDKE